MKKLLTLAFSMLFCSAIFAQQQANLNNATKPTPLQKEAPQDGYYKKDNILSAKVTPYANLREADVMYRKTVYREIDLREKMNRIYASPKARLIDVIMEGVTSGEMTAYAHPVGGDPGVYEFSTVLKPEEAMSKFADSVLLQQYDDNGDPVGNPSLVAGEFNPDSVVKFQIKEDWLFDKQRSIYEPRIIGIAPMIKVKAAGQSLGEQPAFWIYFPEARHTFVTKEVANRSNDATGLSYDDIFMKRIFDSYIVKVSNPDDLRIKDYAQGIDKLYESERVKKELLDLEHDMWSY